MAKFDVKALREKVLTTNEIQYDEVYVEEWDVTLPIKTLSAAELKEVTKYSSDNIRMMILALLHGCKTPEGEAVFLPTDLAQFETQKSVGPIAKVATRILEISGMGEDAVKDAKNN